ncbi:MAG: hypothetical protein IT518_16695 [Burkholderiales bacterium]|nr:hypothetical protein [Burkholderiales bacterium]
MEASSTHPGRDGMQFDVLSPWAEAAPVPLRGISARLQDLDGKRIGLYANAKRASRTVLEAFEKQLRERAPGAKPSWYTATDETALPEMRTVGKEKFIAWLGGVDAVVLAVAD